MKKEQEEHVDQEEKEAVEQEDQQEQEMADVMEGHAVDKQDEADEQSEEAAHKAEIADLNNRLLRVQADYDNFRRRSREEKESAAKYRAQGFVEELLPALDNFERALSVKPEGDEAKSLAQGLNMVYNQLQEALKKEGVTVIETVGETFDPHLHQAVMQVEEEGFESNQIVEELQKGYKLKDRVLRPSMVKVNA
ncbi:nucleotide exchange factor GrpE [Alkalicoccobacillus porphyridii]|uniref:Protein GrpE n=1 Tax=Alkalicoccobacillus porphyridii TaxID=2597270 RepID=A0A553ZZA2_9BACI|nr:nucleotide exchange factor GrpE [Alkalicoccobacillus porphyridii]TSB46774.1 nucleotide exchange factor GrpE [Alkalicoccobacillus porphyridii]